LRITEGGTTASHLYKVLRLPALIGTKVLAVDGKDYMLAGYYPAILSKEEYDELQALGHSRFRRKGKGDIPGIITGLRITHCGYCGSAMVAQNLMGRQRDEQGNVRNSHRRLACCSQQAKRCCPVGSSTSVAPIEQALLHYCSDQMNLDRLLDNRDLEKPLRQRLATARARAADLEKQLERLTNALLQDDNIVPKTLLRKISELEEAISQAKLETARAEEELLSVTRKAPAAADGWKVLVKGVEAMDYDARMQARQLVADTFSRIVVYHRGVQPTGDRDKTFNLDLVLIPHGGVARALRIDRKTGAWRAMEDLRPELIH
jgi:hypothetical protein